jgi:hypothetical protein
MSHQVDGRSLCANVSVGLGRGGVYICAKGEEGAPIHRGMGLASLSKAVAGGLLLGSPQSP